MISRGVTPARATSKVASARDLRMRISATGVVGGASIKIQPNGLVERPLINVEMKLEWSGVPPSS